jgi:hypothetical protein
MGSGYLLFRPLALVHSSLKSLINLIFKGLDCGLGSEGSESVLGGVLVVSLVSVQCAQLFVFFRVLVLGRLIQFFISFEQLPLGVQLTVLSTLSHQVTNKGQKMKTKLVLTRSCT